MNPTDVFVQLAGDFVLSVVWIMLAIRHLVSGRRNKADAAPDGRADNAKLTREYRGGKYGHR